MGDILQPGRTPPTNEMSTGAKVRRNKGVVSGPAHARDNLWEIRLSNQAASTAPEPGKRPSRIKYYKNGHSAIFGRHLTERDERGGKEHFLVERPPLPTKEAQQTKDFGREKPLRATEDHLWDVFRNATYAPTEHSSIRAHYHNQDHLSGVLPGPGRDLGN